MRRIPLLFSLSALLWAQTAPLDFKITNVRIVDGSGNPWFRGEVGIRGDRIAEVGTRISGYALQSVDGKDHVLAPGFIDMNDHSYLTLLVDGAALSKITQGVTSLICGEVTAPAPLFGQLKEEFAQRAAFYGITTDWEDFDGYFARLQRQGITPNLGSYTSANQLWALTVGPYNRRPTASEMDQMKKLALQAAKQGALGLTAGLIYPPGPYFKTEELAELAKVFAPFGGIYSAHIRGESKNLLLAIEETIQIGKSAALPVEIYHLKAAGYTNWWKMPAAIARIRSARDQGVDITANQYPYTAGSTALDAALPPWIQEGGIEKLISRLKDPEIRKKVRAEMEAGDEAYENFYYASRGWKNILISDVQTEKNRPYQGMTVAQIAQQRKQDPFDTAFDLIIEEKNEVGAIFFFMSENDVKEAMKEEWVSVGSDSSAVRPDGILAKSKPHPRAYGTFPRILGKYVRDERVLSLESAIRKMTSLPAQRLALRDRGLVRSGNFADLVLFDPERIQDRATYQNPHQLSEGIEHLWINGKSAVRAGQVTGEKPGRILRR